MKTDQLKFYSCGILIALALTGCDQFKQPEKIDSQYDNRVENTPSHTNENQTPMGQKIDQAGHTLSDTAITAMVKTELISNKTVSGLDIKVSTQAGVVTLSGLVQSTIQREEAEKVALTIGDVRSVENKLIVKTQS